MRGHDDEAQVERIRAGRQQRQNCGTEHVNMAGKKDSHTMTKINTRPHQMTTDHRSDISDSVCVELQSRVVSLQDTLLNLFGSRIGEKIIKASEQSWRWHVQRYQLSFSLQQVTQESKNNE